MKKQFSLAITKKVLTFSFALAVIFGTYAKSFAADNETANAAKSSYISYKGLKDNYLVFKVDYKNENAEPFQLVIKNEQSDVLYAKNFSSQPLNTNVLLTDIPDNSKLTFSILSKKNNVSQSFTIASEVKTTQEYVVKGL